MDFTKRWITYLRNNHCQDVTSHPLTCPLLIEPDSFPTHIRDNPTAHTVWETDEDITNVFSDKQTNELSFVTNAVPPTRKQGPPDKPEAIQEAPRSGLGPDIERRLSRKRSSPGSLDDPRSRTRTTDPETFDRGHKNTQRRLWTETDGSQPKVPQDQSVPPSVEPSCMMLRPETRPVSQDELIVHIKGIYASPVLVETRLKPGWQSILPVRNPKFLSLGIMFSAGGSLNGVPIEANADTGASFNVISKDLANSLGLTPEPGTRREIRLPSGKKIFSPGQLKGLFQFSNEEKTYELSCVILEKASYPLVLGSKFLRLTRTFTKYMHRLEKVFSGGSRFSLNLIGDEQELISGHLNGSRCFAVPDSGSDIMVVSGAYAKAHSLKVDRDLHHRHSVEFIDGSRELTDGFVKDLEWQFREGEKSIRCDFHVIDSLPVDAILSNALIDEYRVFFQYDDLLIQIDSVEDQSGIYNIRLAEKSRDEIAYLEDSFWQDMSSSTPFTDEIIERERARRDVIRDRISSLLEHEQQDQRDRETHRQRRFDEEWRKHRERMAATEQSGQLSLSSSSAQAGAQNGLLHYPAASSIVPLQRSSRWKHWFTWVSR